MCVCVCVCVFKLTHEYICNCTQRDHNRFYTNASPHFSNKELIQWVFRTILHQNFTPTNYFSIISIHYFQSIYFGISDSLANVNLFSNSIWITSTIRTCNDEQLASFVDFSCIQQLSINQTLDRNKQFLWKWFACKLRFKHSAILTNEIMNVPVNSKIDNW